MTVNDDNNCCIPLGSETHVYKFPSRKYRSIEVRSRTSEWETRNSVSTQTSDLEIRVSEPSGRQHMMMMMMNKMQLTIVMSVLLDIASTEE